MQKTKKYLGGITAAAVLAIGLVGCGSTSSKTSDPSTPAQSATTSTALPRPTTTSKPTQSILTDALVEVLREDYPGASRNALIDLAKQACVVIEMAGSVEDALLMIALDPDTDATMAGDMAYVMGVSIPVFCPEYMDELQSLASR